MQFELDDNQRDLQGAARELLQARAVTPKKDDHTLWRELVALDWPGIAIDESFGGLGQGLTETALLVTEHGRSLAATPFVGVTTAARLIQLAGSSAQRERWLPRLANGSIKATAGNNLVGDVQDVSCVVIAHPDQLQLVGEADLEIEPVPTVDQLRSYGRVSGTAELLIGDASLASANAAVLAAAELLGVAERALSESVTHARERVQFGQAIGTFQAVSHRCTELLVLTEAARVAVLAAAWACDADSDGAARAASIAKAAASDAARETTATAIQIHGGYGFTWEAPMHWLYKRAQLAASLWGSATAHRMYLVTGASWLA